MRVMHWVGAVVVAAGAGMMAGCAGGVTQEMYLRPPGATWPEPSKVITEVHISGNEDVLKEVGAVAEGLGMKPDVRSTQRWWIKTGAHEQEGSFSIAVGKMKTGVWDVQLADWPGVSRSELSYKAEKEIVAAVHGTVVVVKR